MAKGSVTITYEGAAPSPVAWDRILELIDTIWGAEARSLPMFPDVIGGITATWVDADGITHGAGHLDEIAAAYETSGTDLISLAGNLNDKPFAHILFTPGLFGCAIEVTADTRERAEAVVAAVREVFPVVPKYLFVSYAKEDIDAALFVAELLENRIAPPITMFVAKRDIGPGKDPRKTMLEEQLLHATALVALCSVDSKQSGWLWWEASSVWTRDKLVIPLFLDISPTEFDGPITLVTQGRSFFVPEELTEALHAIVSEVGPSEHLAVMSPEELMRLNEMRTRYENNERRRDPVREQRFKELLQIVLDLKDAAFEAYEQGIPWSQKMSNARIKMRTLLQQLSDETFPPQVSECSNGGTPGQVIGAAPHVYWLIEQQLLKP